MAAIAILVCVISCIVLLYIGACIGILFVVLRAIVVALSDIRIGDCKISEVPGTCIWENNVYAPEVKVLWMKNNRTDSCDNEYFSEWENLTLDTELVHDYILRLKECFNASKAVCEQCAGGISQVSPPPNVNVTSCEHNWFNHTCYRGTKTKFFGR